MRLYIAIPTYDNWEADTGSSVAGTQAALAVHPKVQQVIHKRCQGSIACDARNDLYKDAMKLGFTHVLNVDSDMVFPPEAVISMIERDLDFVAADYRRRNPPHTTIAVQPDGTPVEHGPGKTGLVEIRSCGLGLSLFRLNMLDRMDYPWSGMQTHANGTLDDSIWFCANAGNAGFKLFCDRDATKSVGHITKQILTIE